MRDVNDDDGLTDLVSCADKNAKPKGGDKLSGYSTNDDKIN